MEIKVWRTSCENPFQTGSKVVKSKKMLYTYAIRIWKRIRTQEVTMGRYLNPGMESFEKSVNSENLRRIKLVWWIHESGN